MRVPGTFVTTDAREDVKGVDILPCYGHGPWIIHESFVITTDTNDVVNWPGNQTWSVWAKTKTGVDGGGLTKENREEGLYDPTHRLPGTRPPGEVWPGRETGGGRKRSGVEEAGR